MVVEGEEGAVLRREEREDGAVHHLACRGAGDAADEHAVHVDLALLPPHQLLTMSGAVVEPQHNHQHHVGHDIHQTRQQRHRLHRCTMRLAETHGERVESDALLNDGQL